MVYNHIYLNNVGNIALFFPYFNCTNTFVFNYTYMYVKCYTYFACIIFNV